MAAVVSTLMQSKIQSSSVGSLNDRAIESSAKSNNTRNKTNGGGGDIINGGGGFVPLLGYRRIKNTPNHVASERDLGTSNCAAAIGLESFHHERVASTNTRGRGVLQQQDLIATSQGMAVAEMDFNSFVNGTYQHIKNPQATSAVLPPPSSTSTNQAS